MDSEEEHKRLLSVRDHHTPIISKGVTYEYPGNLFRVFEYYVPRRSGEGAKKQKKAASKRVRTDNSNTDDSAQRAKTEIRNYILVNLFDLYVTFTFATERESADACMARMHGWLKNWQKRHPKCEYLVVHEYHLDGVSIHFHGLFKNFAGKLEPAISPKTNKQLISRGRRVYSLPQFKHGFTSAVKIDGSTEDRQKLAGYLGKYFTKDIPEFFNKKRYWHSKNLLHPKKLDRLPDWYATAKPTWTKDLQYGRLSWFKFDDELEGEKA